jgi:hypothetical protein
VLSDLELTSSKLYYSTTVEGGAEQLMIRQAIGAQQWSYSTGTTKDTDFVASRPPRILLQCLSSHYGPWVGEYREIHHPRFLKDGRPLVPFSSKHLYYVLARHQDHPRMILLPVLLCLDCL